MDKEFIAVIRLKVKDHIALDQDQVYSEFRDVLSRRGYTDPFEKADIVKIEPHLGIE